MRLPQFHEQLRDAFIGDLAAVWAYARQLYASERPYALVLYGQESPTQLGAYVLTEEGLTEVARRSVGDDGYDTLEQARQAARWSVADARPPKSEAEFFLPTVEQLFAPHAKELGEVRGYQLLAEAGMAALETLDRQGLFGTGAARDAIMLLVDVEGTDLDFWDDSAKRLNSVAAYARFEAEGKIEGEYASCEALAASRSGGSFYLAGARTSGETKQTRREIIAYSIRKDGRLARRWAHTYFADGERVREIAVSPDGAWVYVLRNHMRKGKVRSSVLRFGRGSDSPVAQQDIPFRAHGIDVSHDGARVAIAGDKRTIHLLDASLSPVRNRVINLQPFGVRFLKNGELLVATETKILRLDPMTDAPPSASANVSSWSLSIDAAERVMVVSPFPNAGVPKERERPQVLTVLNLPSLEPLRTIAVPGRDLREAVISPDGRLVACESSPAGSYRGPVVVFDVASGAEIARRKVDQVGALAFLRDSRTVAVANTGMTTSEAVALWTLPTV